MQTAKSLELSRIEEIKIVNNVRLIHCYDLNPIVSTDNLRVQFEISGEIRGAITCYLCLDGQALSVKEKNYLFPLFTEAMNILLGRQISLDDELSKYKISLSSPKLSMISQKLNTAERKLTQKYDLELATKSFSVLTEYNLEIVN